MAHPLELEIVTYQEGKYYVAQCLNVDVSSFGDTQAEALANVREALELYFEDETTDDLAPVERPQVVKLTLQGA
jgi:predicted RNase H-like HicB family nuclease